MSFHAKALSKRCASAADAMHLVRSGDQIIVPTGIAEPPALLTALSEQRRQWRDVKVSQILAVQPYGYIDRETIEHVRHVAFFFGGATRQGGQEGWVDFTPNHFSEIPRLIAGGQIASDVVFSLAAPMDDAGYFALSLGADYTMAAVAQARAVVLEVNPNVPQAHGACRVHVSQVAAWIESEAPIKEVGLPTIGPVQQAIGQFVAERIADGSTLQIGYGGIPDAVVMQLTEKHDLGIHTEMIGDGILKLIECGAVTNRRKNILPGKMLATFALGSKKLYDFMHRNPALEMHPADVTNDPALAGLNDQLVTINATLQIDLLGQCGSESLGDLPYSGTGGQSDFVRAANRSQGGQSFIVLPATAKADTLSRIVPVLSPGTHVSTSKNDVDRVVTEYGVAELRGRSAQQRAAALIAIAHPNFRAELREQARRLRLM